MSRCFPYPPPGFEKKHDPLIDSIKLQKEKEKKKEKKEKKREKKGKSRDKSSLPEDKKKKKRSHDEISNTGSKEESNLKTRNEDTEQLERSSLTEEQGIPSARYNCDSPDSSQNSSKRQKLDTIDPSKSTQGNVLRIRLPSKQKNSEAHDDSKVPCLLAPPKNNNVLHTQSTVAQQTSEGIATNTPFQNGPLSINQKGSALRTPAKESTLTAPASKRPALPTPAPKASDFRPTAPKVPAFHSNAQKNIALHSTSQKSAVLQSKAQKSAVLPSTAQNNAVLQSTAQKSAVLQSMAQKNSTAQKKAVLHSTAQKSAALRSTLPKNAAVPSTGLKNADLISRAQNDTLLHTTAQNEIAVHSRIQSVSAIHFPTSHQQSLLSAKQKEVRPPASFPRENFDGAGPCTTEPPCFSGRLDTSSSKVVETSIDQQSLLKGYQGTSKSRRKEEQFTDLLRSWNPEPIQMELPDDDQDWLFGGKRQHDQANNAKSSLKQNHDRENLTASWPPRACLLQGADAYALPYVLPF